MDIPIRYSCYITESYHSKSLSDAINFFSVSGPLSHFFRHNNLCWNRSTRRICSRSFRCIPTYRWRQIYSWWLWKIYSWLQWTLYPYRQWVIFSDIHIVLLPIVILKSKTLSPGQKFQKLSIIILFKLIML